MECNKGFFLENDKNWEIPIKDGTGKTLYLNRTGSARTKGEPKKKRYFDINKVVWKRHSEVSDIIILIEEIQWANNRKKELRFGYWTQTHEEKPRWWWGQSALMAPIKDVGELFQLAKEEGLM